MNAQLEFLNIVLQPSYAWSSTGAKLVSGKLKEQHWTLLTAIVWIPGAYMHYGAHQQKQAPDRRHDRPS